MHSPTDYHAGATAGRTPVESMPENVRSVQPGGGYCYELEMAWGRLRRWYLKRFRPGYVDRMARLRRGDSRGAPHEILDPRDLKFARNLCSCEWDPADDPFRWRERLPFARWGLAELQIMGWPLLALTLLGGWWSWYAAIGPAIALALVVWFFRDPPRRVPQDAGLIVSPADGKIAEIARLDHEPFVGGPAVRVSIFLSIFNVHVNRAPCRCRVIGLRYHPGEFLNALNPACSLRNENMWIGLEADQAPFRRISVRQIAGAIARRIVCAARLGETLERGQRFGMIKLGSRTELVLPDSDGLELSVTVSDHVYAGSTILARYRTGG